MSDKNPKCIFPIDARELKMIKGKVSAKWKGGTDMKKMAIEYGIEEFHKLICDKLL